MKNFVCFVFILFGVGISAFRAQNADIRRTYKWYFGSKAGLDFSTNPPTPITNSAMTAEEGCATISDTCGNLLFYSDGDTVWNMLHQPMPNGTGLMGCWSSTQGALIIPQPGNDSIYYQFTTDCGENYGANGLRYSKININLNGGLGDVIEKNTLVQDSTLEKLAATYHSNGVDVWITVVNIFPVGPPPDLNYSYFTYLLTNSGLNPMPVVSPSKLHAHKWGDSQIIFSPDGTKLANSWHGTSGLFRDSLELMLFDKATGALTNAFVLVPDSALTTYGNAFSPDNKKLYHTIAKWSVGPTYYRIYQYDVSIMDSAIIAASKTIIRQSDITTPLVPQYYGIQSGANGTLFVTKENMVSPFYTDTLDIIANPNAQGTSSNFIHNGQYCANNVRLGLPNFIPNFFSGSWIDSCVYEGIIFNSKNSDNWFVYPNPGSGTFFLEQSSENFDGQGFNCAILNPEGIELAHFRVFGKSISFDLSGYPAGLYLVKLQNQHSLSILKVLLLNP